jgi:hypothetical protein
MTNPTNPLPVETTGDPDSPIWLLGDSPSAKHLDKNLKPLDRIHPTRHTIWTPILDVVQCHLFVKCGRRLDDGELFIRNAVSHPNQKENSVELEAKIAALGEDLKKHKPLLVLCFGWFAFEFARRAQKEEKKPPQKWKEWNIKELRQQLDARILDVQLGSVTLLPLLHQIVALKFWICHPVWGGNYFDYTGWEIAQVLIKNHTDSSLKMLCLPAKQNGTVSE